MKSALSLTLIGCLVGPALTASAQELIWPGPITRAISREAGRVAAVQREPVDPDWSRVRKLEPGTEIMVTATGSQPGKRSLYFQSADESGLTVLADLASHNWERISRSDVIAIVERRTLPSHSWIKRHPAATGLLVGLGSGAVFNLTPLIGLRTNLGVFSPLPPCRDGNDDPGLCLLVGLTSAGIGAGLGAAIGAVVGASRDKTQDVIYRAP